MQTRSRSARSFVIAGSPPHPVSNLSPCRARLRTVRRPESPPPLSISHSSHHSTRLLCCPAPMVEPLRDWSGFESVAGRVPLQQPGARLLSSMSRCALLLTFALLTACVPREQSAQKVEPGNNGGRSQVQGGGTQVQGGGTQVQPHKRECEASGDCIQVGTCILSPPSCEPRATYMQAHCADAPRFKVPSFTCECRAGRCVVGKVNRAGDGEVDYPPIPDARAPR